MKGLLYKDYVATGGKWYVLSFAGFMILYFILSILTRGTEWATILIMWLLMAPAIAFMIMQFNLFQILFVGDCGKNCKEYLFSLPVSKKDYVGGKYVYVLIFSYVVNACVGFGTMISYAFWIDPANEEIALNGTMFLNMAGLLALCLACGALILAAIEFPFYILFGVKKAQSVITVVFSVMVGVIICVMLFVDLSVLDKINLMAISEYLYEHMEVQLILSILGPVITGALYYGSYRFTTWQLERKEWEYEA